MDPLEIDILAKTLWDYHHVHHHLEKADVMLVLGSHDTRVAHYAADIFLQGYAPYIIFSGGFGNLTKNVFTTAEAETFAGIAMKQGVPQDQILIESRSTNTGENIRYSKQLIEERGLDFHSFLLVQKPYMERRAYATFKKVWPEKECMVTSPPISFEDYPTQEIPKEHVINIMVGDLQRIKIYPELGFQIPQDIPAYVWAAYEQLVKQGFTKHLVKN